MSWLRRFLISKYNPEFYSLQAEYAALTDRYRLATRFIDPQVMQYQLKNSFHTNGEIKDVCIMFTDLRGFTKFSEGATLAATNSFLNNYYDIAIHHTQRSGGIVDKLVGDGTMSLFGNFTKEHDFSLNALRAAKGIMRDFKQMTMQKNEPNLHLGIGITEGKVLVGTFGNGEFVNFTAIGPAVNLAARIQEKALENKIYVTKEIARYLQPDQYKEAGRVLLKNVAKAVSLFEVL